MKPTCPLPAPSVQPVGSVLVQPVGVQYSMSSALIRRQPSSRQSERAAELLQQNVTLVGAASSRADGD